MKQYLGTTWSDFIGQYGVNPSPTTWKHAYFFFTDEVYSNASKGYRYKVWLQSYTKGGGAHFLAIDNVRLVTIH